MSSTHRTMPIRAALLGALTLVGCGETPTTPDPVNDPGADPEVASVTVTSPIGESVPVAFPTTLTATARDASGQTVTATITWSATPTSVATVSANGTVTGVGAGTATITASVDGVPGSLTLEVMDIDLPAIVALTDDAFVDALFTGIGEPVETSLRALWGECATGAASGNVSQIASCVTDLPGELQNAGATERPLASLVGLYDDLILRLLDLPTVGMKP